MKSSQNRQEGGSGGPLCCGAGVRAESPGAGDLDRVEVILMMIINYEADGDDDDDESLIEWR